MIIDEEIKNYGLKNGVPITKDDTLSLICEIVNKNNCKQILEIGTAIGFGSLTISINTKLEHLDSVEIDKERCKIAKKNIKNAKMQAKISVFNADAKDFLKTCDKKYDLVYLDGPKGQYINYLPDIVRVLIDGGIIVADNLYFHGMVTGKIPISRGCRAMIKGLKAYINEITTNPIFETKIFDIGDGVGVSVVHKQ